MRKSLLISCIVTICSLMSLVVNAQEKKKKNLFKDILGIGVSVSETSDKFDDTKTYQMKGNKVYSVLSTSNAAVNLLFGKDGVTFDTFLNLEKHVLKDNSYNLSIIFKVKAENELFVEVREGKSLIFLLDDSEKIELSTKGSFNKDFDMMKQTSVAHARYPITKDLLKKINNSKKVEFRILLDSYSSGEAEERDRDQQHLDGDFNKKNKKAWTEFYADYVAE